MMNFTVKEDKCVNCGLCSAECPVLIINNKTAFPTIKEGKEGNCLKCQHCLTICPHEAISIWGYQPEDSIPNTAPKAQPELLGNLMQLRRSIRKFTNEELEAPLIHELITLASYAPTAKNENSVQFTVVDNKSDMLKLRDLTYKHIKKASEANRIPASLMYLNNFQMVWESKQVDVIFRDAPHLVITSTPKNATQPEVDGTIAMTYFDLLANSNGIGTLWDGFAKNVFEDISPEIKTEMGIPEDHMVVAVLAFGKAAVKHARSIQNKPTTKRICL